MSHKPLTDLPGITSDKDLASGVVPLKPADVQFYIKIMRATLDRYQHPTPQDAADIAEVKRLHQLQTLGQSKMAEDMKAGNMQKAMNDMFHPTPEQQATLDRGEALLGDAPQMLAKDAGMPGRQWSALYQVVEHAAGWTQIPDTVQAATTATRQGANRMRSNKNTRRIAGEFRQRIKRSWRPTPPKSSACTLSRYRLLRTGCRPTSRHSHSRTGY